MIECVKQMISSRLREVREKYQLTQRQAARKLGVSERTYRDYENGKTGNLARAFNILKWAGLVSDDDKEAE